MTRHLCQPLACYFPGMPGVRAMQLNFTAVQVASIAIYGPLGDA